MKKIFFQLLIQLLLFLTLSNNSYSDWKELKIGNSLVWDFYSDSTSTFLFGKPSIMYSSNDFGKNWNELTLPSIIDQDIVMNYYKKDDFSYSLIYNQPNTDSRIYISMDNEQTWDTLVRVSEKITNAVILDSANIIFSQFTTSHNKTYFIKASLLTKELDTLSSTSPEDKVYFIYSMIKVDDTTLVCGTMNGYLGISKDAGVTWSYQKMNHGRFPRLKIVNNKVWAFSEAPFESYYSDDNGNSWTKLLVGYELYSCSHICSDKYKNLYLLTNSVNNGFTNPLLLKSTDDGLNWEEIYSNKDHTFSCIFANEYAIFIGTKDGYILWNTDITSVSNSQNEIVDFPISPNPAEDFINIEDLYGNIIEISVIDIAGLTVNTNITLNSTIHRLDISALRSGIYFVLLKTPNSIKKYKFIKN